MHPWCLEPELTSTTTCVGTVFGFRRLTSTDNEILHLPSADLSRLWIWSTYKRKDIHTPTNTITTNKTTPNDPQRHPPPPPPPTTPPNTTSTTAHQSTHSLSVQELGPTCLLFPILFLVGFSVPLPPPAASFKTSSDTLKTFLRCSEDALRRI